MDTITRPLVMVFEKDQQVNYKEVRHYNFVEGENLFSEKVHISKDRQFSKSKAKYWFRIREYNKWSNCLTGLFPTSNGMVYYGDTERKKNLLIFIFSEYGERLNIYFFSNFYPKEVHEFIKMFFIDIIQKRSD